MTYFQLKQNQQRGCIEFAPKFYCNTNQNQLGKPSRNKNAVVFHIVKKGALFKNSNLKFPKDFIEQKVY